MKQLGWAETAPGLLKGALAKLAEKAGSLEARATQVRGVLSRTESRHARTVVGFDMAAGSLEKAAYKAGVAKELAKPVPGDLVFRSSRCPRAHAAQPGIKPSGRVGNHQPTV